MKVRMLFVALAVFALAGCGSQPAGSAAQPRGEPATVRFVEVETGCWVLETSAGRVQPLDLPAEFQRDGLEVSAVLRDAPEMLSACQVGPLKTIEHIEKR